MNKINILLLLVLCGNSAFYGMKRHLERAETPTETPTKKFKFSSTQKDDNSLLTLVRIGDLDSAEQLLRNGSADINARTSLDTTALKVAIENHNIPMIELLLRYNPTDKCFFTLFNKNDNTILHRYLTNSDLTQEDMNTAYDIAKKIQTSEEVKSMQYAHVSTLFIEYYKQKPKKSVRYNQTVTTAGIRSTVLRDVNIDSANKNEENYFGS